MAGIWWIVGKLKVVGLDQLPKGKYHDGEGLYFDKKIRGASWMFKFTLNGVSREMGLGKFPEITLVKARELATKARSQRAEGIVVAVGESLARELRGGL